jgi:hypothetical protein
MVAANPNYRFPPPEPRPIRPVNRLARPPLSVEDLRIHAWLSARLAAVRYQRHGLRPRLRRFLLGDRLARWLKSRRLGAPGGGNQ